MNRAFTIIRVSAQDQLKGYGPAVQWSDDVVANAPMLGLEVTEANKRVIQESATGWERTKFEAAAREALDLYHRGGIEVLLFPRVDRETRFIFGSITLLVELVHAGLKVCFAREKLFLDPNDPESVERYLNKANQAQAYAETTRLNTMRGRRIRATQDHMMPTGCSKWAHDYHCYSKDSHQATDAYSGRYTVNPERAVCVKKWTKWLLVDGLSLRKCCARMERDHGLKISRSVMVGVLEDPALIGKFYAYKTKIVRDGKGRKHKENVDPKDWVLVYEDPAQAILTEEQFYAIRERLIRNKQNACRNANNWYPPLRSLVFCVCGSRMTGAYLWDKGNREPRYRCPICKRYVEAKPLWMEIKEGIKTRLLQPELLIPAIKQQLDSGHSIARLEEELKSNRQQLDVLEQAEQKALRLHLYLPNYPVEKLDGEMVRITDRRHDLEAEQSSLEERLAGLKQAILNEEGLRRFCQIASRNLETLDDRQWRLLLETMKLRVVLGEGGEITIKIAVPGAQDEDGVIVTGTSGSCLR